MDVLSDILQTFRLRSSVFAMAELPAPWGMSTAGRDEAIFHVILRGVAWLEADGYPPAQVAAGDVVLVAPHRGHSLRDAKGSPVRPVEQLLAEGVFAPDRKPPAGVSTTQLMCGCFHVEDGGARMLLSALPALVHLRDVPHVGPWLEHTVKLMSYEATRDRPGAETVVNRLCDALFVYVLRGVVETMASANASWLRGLADPHVGAAMRLIHERPADPWSVATLAAAVGLSRSGFALRFTELVGEPPMRYLTRWRLQKAAELLGEESHSIAEVAARAGYDSESSFHKAFKRTLGVAPGAYRRRSGAPAPAIEAAP
jgi:AraC-like DNA-binding protein